MLDNELQDYRVGIDPLNNVSQLKSNLKKLKTMVAVDYSFFKEKRAYELKKLKDSAYFINYIAVDPRCGLPMALGFIVTPSGMSPKEMLLSDLKRIEVHF